MIALYEEQIENRINSKNISLRWHFLCNLLYKDDLIYNAIKTSTRTQIRPHTVILEVIHIVFLKWRLRHWSGRVSSLSL